MNERIRELAKQAGIDFFNSTDPEYCGRVYCEGWLEQQQKFAELIVKECMELCKKQEYNYWASSEDQDFTPIDCADAISVYFGVKE